MAAFDAIVGFAGGATQTSDLTVLYKKFGFGGGQTVIVNCAYDGSPINFAGTSVVLYSLDNTKAQSIGKPNAQGEVYFTDLFDGQRYYAFYNGPNRNGDVITFVA